MSKVLVVGASSGIGLELMKTLSANETNVIAISRSGDVIRGMSNVHHLEFDVLDKQSELPEINQPLDGIAYLPGTITLKPFKLLRLDDFLEDFEVNLLGAVRVLQRYLPNLTDSVDSSIVLVSTVAVQTGMAYHASIASAKGAVEGLIRSLAAELAPRVRVNGVAPSLTNTPLTSHLINSPGKQDMARKRHPLGRIGEPQDIAAMIAYLLSDKARWITGQIFAVDGGMSSVRML